MTIRDLRTTPPPKTLDEAIQFLFESLTPAERVNIRKHTPETFHHGGGTALRNHWNLWNRGTRLNKDIQNRFQLFGHGDDCSGLIMTGLWAKVRGEDVAQALETVAAQYRAHWRKAGINPETGKHLRIERKAS